VAAEARVIYRKGKSSALIEVQFLTQVTVANFSLKVLSAPQLFPIISLLARVLFSRHVLVKKQLHNHVSKKFQVNHFLHYRRF